MLGTSDVVGDPIEGTAGANGTTAGAQPNTHATPAQVVPAVAVQDTESWTFPVAPPAAGPTVFEKEPICEPSVPHAM